MHHPNHPAPAPCRQSFPANLLRIAMAAAFSALGNMGALADTTISSTIGSITNSEAANFTVVPGGAIVGATIGYVNTISTGTLDNRGTIRIDLSTPNSYAISNTGTIQSLLNSGTIGGYNGITNTITTGTVTRTGTIGSIVNSGTIDGYANGIFSRGPITRLQNNAGATISGASIAGIYNGGAMGTLTNAGMIKGAIGIFQSGGVISLLSNSGGIIGGNGGGISNSGSIGVLVNTGVITVTGSGSAISNNGTMSLIRNSGTIAGAIISNVATGMTINGGTGAVFGTLTGLNGAVGNFSHTGANLTFGTGNQLLNDNIVATNRTVTNLAGTLMLTNPVTITGDYAQAAAATLLIGVRDNATSKGEVSDTGYGSLRVSGNSTLAGGTSIVLTRLNTYAFAPGQRFVVLRTGGTATYNLADLKYSVAGYAGDVSIASVAAAGATNLIVALPARPLPAEQPEHRSNNGPTDWYVFDVNDHGDVKPVIVPGAVDDNAAAALGKLLVYDGLDDGLLNLSNAVLALPGASQARRAGAQLNPAAVKSSAAKSVNVAMDAMAMIASSHLNDVRPANGCAAGGDQAAAGSGLWGQFLGGRIGMQQREDVSGYHANYRGLLAGGDGRLGDCMRIGALLSYAGIRIASDDANSGSSADVDSRGVTVYASFTGQPWYGNLMASVAQQRYRTLRAIDFPGFSGNAAGRFNGRSHSTVMQAGYPLPLASGAILTPMAELAYSVLRQDAYVETGGAGALAIAAAGTHSLKSDLGLKWQRTLVTAYGELAPAAELRWRHEFHDARLRTSSSFATDLDGAGAFASAGSTPGKNSALLVVGATLKRSKRLGIMFNYFLEAAAGYRSHAGDARLTWEF